MNSVVWRELQLLTLTTGGKLWRENKEKLKVYTNIINKNSRAENESSVESTVFSLAPPSGQTHILHTGPIPNRTLTLHPIHSPSICTVMGSCAILRAVPNQILLSASGLLSP